VYLLYENRYYILISIENSICIRSTYPLMHYLFYYCTRNNTKTSNTIIDNCFIKLDDKLHSINYDILKFFMFDVQHIQSNFRGKRLTLSFLADEDKFNFLKGVRNENKVFKTNFGGDFSNKSPIK
jgi:hypothetical protein